MILRYWSWAPNIAKIVDVWNAQNPDIQVEVNTSTGSNDIVAKLSAAKEAGTLPDLSNTSYENLPNLVVNGIAADITDAFGDYEDQIAPAAWNLTTFDGKNYAVPQGTGPQFLFYRTDLFEAAGVEAPTTWDEYADAAPGDSRRRSHQVPRDLPRQRRPALRGAQPAGRRGVVEPVRRDVDRRHRR